MDLDDLTLREAVRYTVVGAVPVAIIVVICLSGHGNWIYFTVVGFLWLLLFVGASAVVGMYGRAAYTAFKDYQEQRNTQPDEPMGEHKLSEIIVRPENVTIQQVDVVNPK